MTTLTMPLNYRKLNKFILNYSTLVAYFRREIKANFNAKSISIIKKYATTQGEYAGYAHYAFYDENNEFVLVIVVDVYSLEVKLTELPRKNGKIFSVEPKNFPERRLNIVFSSKAKK